MGIDASVLAAFLTPKHMIIIVLLYVIGMGLKKYKNLKDNFIPVILTLLSFGLCLILAFASDPLPGTFQSTMNFVFNIIMQSFACVACSVYFNQLGKQMITKFDKDKTEESE